MLIKGNLGLWKIFEKNRTMLTLARILRKDRPQDLPEGWPENSGKHAAMLHAEDPSGFIYQVNSPAPITFCIFL